MDIRELQRHWNKQGKIDPLWGIITRPDKKGGKWQKEEFFAIGERQVTDIMKHVESLGIEFPRGKALDFGCGVGRLTQPLCRHFDEVYGVDIAPSMLELAAKYNRYSDKCKYRLNETDDLKLFADDSFDFIYTDNTLHHMEPRYSKNYIKEFLRILTPHGLLVFQLACEPLDTEPLDKGSITRRLKQRIRPILPATLLNLYRTIIRQPLIEMHGVKREEAVKLLEENGATIVNITKLDRKWLSYLYYVKKGPKGNRQQATH